MIVTAGTSDGQSEKGRTAGADHVVEFVVFGLEFVIRFVVVDSEAKESGGNDRLVPTFVVGLLKASSSPAICSRTNWSYGRSRLNEWMT